MIRVAGAALLALALFVIPSFGWTGAYYNADRAALEIFNGSREQALSLNYKPSGIAANQSGSLVYILNSNANELEVYDAATLQRINRQTVGIHPSAVAVSKSDGRIYILGKGDSSLTVLQPGTLKQLARTTTLQNPSSIAVDSDRHVVYAGSGDLKLIQAFDAFTLKRIAQRSLSMPALELAVSGTKSRVFVRHASIVSMLDAASLESLGILTIWGAPRSLYLSNNGAKLYIPYQDEAEIAIVDASNGIMEDQLSLTGKSVNGKAVDPDRWYFDGSDFHFFTVDGERLSSEQVAAVKIDVVSAGVPGSLTGQNPFRINDYTNKTQDGPYLDFDQDGNFVSVWIDKGGRDGNGYGVYGRELDNGAVPSGGNDFKVNNVTSGNQWFPIVAVADNGDNVIVYRDDNANDGSNRGVFMHGFLAGGAQNFAEKPIGKKTKGTQSGPWVAVEPNGDFVCSWDGPGDGGDHGIFARRFQSNGSPKDAEDLDVNTVTGGNQYNPSIAVHKDGRFVVIWTSAEGSDLRVRYRIFNADGTPAMNNDDQVDTGGGKQFTGAVAMAGNGNWTAVYLDKRGGISYRTMDLDNNPLPGFANGSKKASSTLAASNLVGPITVGCSDHGECAITWRDTSDIVWVRYIDKDGVPIGDIFKACSGVSGQAFCKSTQDMLNQSINMDNNGNFTVAWKSRGPGDPVGRRFKPDFLVSCSADVTIGLAPLLVNFTSSATGGVGAYSYSWDFGDSSPLDTSKNPSHAFLVTGSYTATVTVTTSTGEQQTCQQSIQAN